ncbi:hypothetical protein JR065_17035 [Xanthomonas sp. AmX2]|uniref:hypothetical protein n=1 Tax=Xanthomonas sp. TaxID=29446 RepID=UPI0019820901|nr:hypothetical protein [Xanthomonas sp.]MBN6152051.1 hypothetical protein [Xanthomonas sp.]
MTPPFPAAWARRIGTAFARPMALADALGECGWRRDPAEGIAQFGNDLRVAV